MSGTAAPQAPTEVFVSYRRVDAPYAVDSIVGRLEGHFGEPAVFRDDDDIRKGDDWRAAIEGALATARVCVVVIGPHWAADRRGERRLDEPDDWVAYEVARALERDVVIIPVRVAGAGHPAAGDLPERIRDLAHRQGMEVRSGRDLERDLGDLVAAVAASGVPPARPPDPVRAALLARVGAVADRLWADTVRDHPQVAPRLLETPSMIEPAGWFGTGEPIADVMAAFERGGGVLLIHGPPGSGKSTEALALVRSLLRVARREQEAPLPLRLDLASWASHGGEIEDWIAEQHVRLPVGRDVLLELVAEERFVPVLDGLDEVVGDRRQACLDAIGRYLERRRLKRMVVCTRTAEYEALSGRLPGGLAVEVGRLDLGQLERYLASDEGWRPVLAELASRPRRTDGGGVDPLWRLLERPLGLSIAVQAYAEAGDPAELIDDPGAAGLWSRYTAVAVERGLAQAPLRGYDGAAVARWLGYLASHRRATGAVEIWLHELPLPQSEAVRGTWVMSARFGLLAGTLVGLAVAIGRAGLRSAVAAAAGVAAALILSMGMSRWFLPERRFGLRMALTPRTVAYGTYMAASVGGVGVGLPMGLIRGDVASGLVWGFLAFAGLGLSLLAAALFVDFTRFDARDPFALMRASLRLAAAGGGLCGSLTGLAVGWAAGDAAGSVLAGLAAGLLAAIGVGAVTGVLLGGTMLTEYWEACQYQARSGLGPFRYARFLEWAARNVLLHRSGATYRFVHVELRDHLAGVFDAARENAPRAGEDRPVSSAL